MSDYDRSPDYFDLYDPQGIKCIDSAMRLCKPGTFNFLELKGLKDLQTGDYNDGRATYISLLNLHSLTPHQFAVNACCLSYIYEVKGPQEKSLQLLIRAAISDILVPFESGKDYGKVYFPEGTRYCLYTGEKENGTQEKIIPLKINKLPVYVKGGSIIPMQSLIQTTAEQPTDTLYLHIYNGSEANRFIYYEDDGKTFDYKKGDYYKLSIIFDPAKRAITFEPAEGNYSSHFKYIKLILHGFEQVSAIQSGNDKIIPENGLFAFLGAEAGKDLQDRTYPIENCIIKQVMIGNISGNIQLNY